VPELGRLEEMLVRSVWSHEAHGFTPWLLDHADHLAQTLGIDLELQESEHPVGGFALDLIGRDLTNDVVLIVENQLEPTDHPHLGQILTYAAGTDARTIVWIATAFREEHRQALDWLNEQTREDVRFFGVELRVVRIGDSLPAPLFSVAAEPNDWQKQVRSGATGGDGARAALYSAFWWKYLEQVRARHPGWTRARKPSNQNWMDFSGPVRGTRINPSFAQGRRLRHEIYIDTGDGERNKAMFNELAAQRQALEGAYGRPLDFELLPNARASRIAEYRPDADVRQEDRHQEYIDWLIDAGERLRWALDAVGFRGEGQ
jgi:hypothetical protein